MEAGLLDAEGGLVGQQAGEAQVVLVEAARLPAAQPQHADGPTADEQGDEDDAGQRAGFIAAAVLPRLAALKGVQRARAEHLAQRAAGPVVGGAQGQAAVARFRQQQGGGVGLQQARHFGHQEVEQRRRVEVGLGAVGEVEQQRL